MQYRKHGLLEEYLLLKAVYNKHLTRYKLRIELRNKGISTSISQFYQLIKYLILKDYVKIDKDFTCIITSKGIKRIMELETFIKETIL
jgi:hypothetical protein